MATGDARGHSAARMVPRLLIWLIVGLFFLWGGVTSLNDILIPKLKGVFSLSYAEVMLTQFAFFIAYFVVSVPAGVLVARVGYLRGLVFGLVTMAAGALLFWPAVLSGVYVSFLIALFVLAGGITILQVAANPLVTTLGDPESASSRLTFAQAFNSLGTTIWPYIGAWLILGSAETAARAGAAQAGSHPAETAVVAHVYLGIAAFLLVVALIFWLQRDAVREEHPEAVGFAEIIDLLRHPRVAFGVLALFVYVGAEVYIGSILVSYLGLPSTMHLDAEAAGQHLSFYWGGAMVGRFIGSGLLRIVAPGKLLACAALGAAALVLVSASGAGLLAGWSLIAVGLCNSIMFPTIFSLALEGLGEDTPEASGLLCMAIVGGALVPLAAGAVADRTSIAISLMIPVVCYATIAAFGWSARRPVAT